MKSIWKLSLLSALVAAWAFTALPASADTVSYALNASGCPACTLPAGTVTLTQSGSDAVLVNVGLNSGYDFHPTQGGQHGVFDFNNAATLTASNISNITGTLAPGTTPYAYSFSFLGAGSYSAPPSFGPFDYAFSLTVPSGPHSGNSDITGLSFLVTSSGALPIGSFNSNGNAYFSTDLINPGAEFTGNFGAVGPPISTLSSVPEPSSLLLFGTGVLGFAGFLGLKHGRAAKGVHTFETSGGLA
ncbi:MAG: PEP-CTERM sorting domain-containing protein [Acidobacteriaceae bacterium]